MADLREKLAKFEEEAENIFDALGDREWPRGKISNVVHLLRGDLDDLLRHLSYLIGEREAWEEEE